MAADFSKAAGGWHTVLQQLKHSLRSVTSCLNVFFFLSLCVFSFSLSGMVRKDFEELLEPQNLKKFLKLSK